MQVKSIAECSRGEHSTILLTFIKLPFVIKFFVRLFLSGCFTQVLLYQCEDSIEKSIPHDNRLSSLSKPHDAKSHDQTYLIYSSCVPQRANPY